MLVASGTGHLQAWSGRERAIHRALVTAVRASSVAWRWYPGDLIGFGRQPHALMRDWLHVVRTDTYRPSGSEFDYEACFRHADLDVLEIGVADDPIAPAAARASLVARLRRVRVRHVEVARAAGQSRWRAHFAWARSPDATVRVTAEWLASRDRHRKDAHAGSVSAHRPNGR